MASRQGQGLGVSPEAAHNSKYMSAGMCRGWGSTAINSSTAVQYRIKEYQLEVARSPRASACVASGYSVETVHPAPISLTSRDN